MDDFCNFIAGWGAGIVGLVVGHPMDTVKTNQQMMSIKISNSQIALDILEKEGVHGLYRGMLFPLLCSGTINAVFFGVYGYCLRNLQELRGHPASLNMPTTSNWYLDTFLGGCIGGLGQVIVSCPSDVVKVRLQSGKVISFIYIISMTKKYK
ncbi:solute carrier family 25 member 45-like isoform X1 [Neodiprion pinetum]|uniref:solute carrier family 25 member 45-like isoform X1 n=1 Tax=Neodiprion pinetum TaxID=441929 RepID=UPI001EDDDF68|nr:solute carrier family 25 member 45-like isoform X3 [Neodiprion pinetum]